MSTDLKDQVNLIENTQTIPDTSPCKRKLEQSDEVDTVIKRAKVAPFKEENEDKAEYYFENGLRKVYPYYYTYSTFCKGRWVGKRLLDVFAQEFRAYTEDHYRESVLSGKLTVNNEKISPDYILKDNDCIRNKVHRHEVGVIACPIKIIHENDELIGINKPPSIPVHPCGRYRHNSLLFILKKEHNLKDLHVIHRLDRLTSGVTVLAKTLKKSQELDEQIRTHKMMKEYICRVEGLFPDGEVSCSEPVEILSPKIGVCIVSPTGKECFTTFKKLSYNGKSSVVKCMPKTGRMHQIRVHLQYLGFPILNDPIYNHQEVFGLKKGKLGETGKSREELLTDLMKIQNLDNWLHIDDASDSLLADKKCASKENNTLLNVLNHNLCLSEYSRLEEQYKKDPEKFFVEQNCDFCHKRYRDPEPKDLLLFLHAQRYKSDTFEFEAELPMWAADDWLEM